MCQEQLGPGVHPAPICHEWNTIAHPVCGDKANGPSQKEDLPWQ